MATRVMEGARRERNEKRLLPSFLAALPLDARAFATRRSRPTLIKSEEKVTTRSLVEICFIFSYLITLFSFPET